MTQTKTGKSADKNNSLETRTDIQAVCVYCGSSSKARPVYQETATATGRILAENGYDMVYGGARVGLMGLAADAALAAGAQVTGVMPKDLIQWELEHTGLTELVEVSSMHERKMEMVERSDAFVILPGGLGTLDETFEVLTWKQLNLHDKPIILVNLEGYWDHLLALLRGIIAEKFALDTTENMFQVISEVGDIPRALKEAPRSYSEVATKWM